MYDLGNHVGRLIEIRIHSLTSTNEVQDFGLALRKYANMGRLVFCADARLISVLAPDVTDLFLGNLRRDNPLIERTAFLVSAKKATFRLQLERMIREANNPARRAFDDVGKLEGWLGQVLDDQERRRLAIFLASSSTGG